MLEVPDQGPVGLVPGDSSLPGHLLTLSSSNLSSVFSPDGWGNGESSQVSLLTEKYFLK